MYTYHSAQWLTFFYIYSFIGWCFESSYVSLKKRKPVNRGFMRGPMLPLYGFGAVLILFTTIPVRESVPMTYLISAVSATVLEYITGVCMEALFHVRYWDYSDQKFQFQGHICLSSTLAWGVLGLIMVRVHEPFEWLVFQVPLELLTILVLAVTFFAAVDFANAFRAAIDLKHLLAASEKLQAELLVLQSRAEQIEARIRLEKEEFRQKREAELLALQEKADQLGARVEWEKELLSQKLEDFSQELSEELALIREKQIIYRNRLREQISPDKLRLLRRNPDASSRRYREMLERIKKHQAPGGDS